jgi:predicted ferric reductase
MVPRVSDTSHAEARSRRLAVGAFWVGLYLIVALAPLALIFVGPTPPGRGFWRELSVALGFVGLSTMGLQFAVTARFRHLALPYGIDVVIRFHRQIALVAGALVVAHPIIIFVDRPELLRLLDVTSAPWRARFGVASVVLLAVLTVMAVWRARLRVRYEPWRVTHGVLGVLAVAFALVHVELVGYYVSLPWQRGLWIVMSAVMVALLVYTRIVKPLRLRARPWRVAEVRPERGASTTLVLEPVGHEGIDFAPGQFAWLTLADTPFAIEEHPFSFSSSAGRPERPEMTIKDLGDFTSRVRETEVGRRAYLEGPHGAFTIDRYDGPGYVFIAGGVGITPIMSMVRTLADRGDTRHHELIYQARTEDDLTFREDIDALAGSRLDLEAVYVLSRPPEGWSGERGRITTELLRRHVVDDWPSHRYFVCGPQAMMDSVERELLAGGVPLHNIYTEEFALG